MLMVLFPGIQLDWNAPKCVLWSSWFGESCRSYHNLSSLERFHCTCAKKRQRHLAEMNNSSLFAAPCFPRVLIPRAPVTPCWHGNECPELFVLEGILLGVVWKTLKDTERRIRWFLWKPLLNAEGSSLLLTVRHPHGPFSSPDLQPLVAEKTPRPASYKYMLFYLLKLFAK